VCAEVVSLVSLQEQFIVVFLLKKTFVSWSLVMDEHGRHEDLCGSDRRSVIAYVNGRIELYCSSLYESKPFLFSIPRKWRLPDPFIAQCQIVTMRLRVRQMIPRWLKPYTISRALMTRSS
jgi:hypothetical protein